MSTAQVDFIIPSDIEQGLQNGTLIRFGGIVRNEAGQIVKHLEEVDDLANEDVKENADPAAEEETNSLNPILEFVKENKILIAGAAAIAAAVGGIVYFVRRSKKRKQKAVSQCVADFSQALMAYVDAIRLKCVSQEHIDAVLNALDAIKENMDKGLIDSGFKLENAALLLEMIKDYTEKLADANGYELPDGIELRNDNIVDIRKYLAIQKDVFSAS